MIGISEVVLCLRYILLMTTAVSEQMQGKNRFIIQNKSQSGSEKSGTEIFPENQVGIPTDDPAIVLSMSEERVLVFHEEIFEIPVPYKKWCINIFCVSSTQFSTQRVKITQTLQGIYSPSYWYRDSHYKPESQVYNGDSYTHDILVNRGPGGIFKDWKNAIELQQTKKQYATIKIDIGQNVFSMFLRCLYYLFACFLPYDYFVYINVVDLFWRQMNRCVINHVEWGNCISAKSLCCWLIISGILIRVNCRKSHIPINSSPPGQKWSPFCRGYFQMDFREWKVLYVYFD